MLPHCKARHDTAVAEKLALVSRATRATCIFGISGLLLDVFVFAQFEGFSARERIARAARKMQDAQRRVGKRQQLASDIAEKSEGCLGGDVVTERRKPSQNAIKVV